mgnify:FL=1
MLVVAYSATCGHLGMGTGSTCQNAKWVAANIHGWKWVNFLQVIQNLENMTLCKLGHRERDDKSWKVSHQNKFLSITCIPMHCF